MSEKNFIFKDPINCKTSNVVYGIKCVKCDKIVYIGETANSIYTRFQNHLSSIKRQTDDPVASHFNSKGHDKDCLKIIGVEKIKGKDIHFRKIRESFWIKKMGTLIPNGLNQNLGIGDGDRNVDF